MKSLCQVQLVFGVTLFFAMVFAACAGIGDPAAASPRPDKVLFMAIVAHPDDEPCGLLACYGGGLGLPVLWIQMTSGDAYGGRMMAPGPACGRMRENECLAAARQYGLTSTPIFARYPDGWGWQRDRVAENLLGWGGLKKSVGYVVGLLRQYRPEIVWSHEPNGEYGHNNHKTVSLIVREAVVAAADPSRYRDLPGPNRPWQVKKVYLAYYKPKRWYELQAILPGLGGRSVLAAANAGFRSHVSQGKLAESTYAAAYGGLWSSTVGVDAVGDDLLENIDLGPWHPWTIHGTVALADGKVSPPGGCRVALVIVNEAGQSWRRAVHIPAGKNATWFHLLRGMETGKSYRIGVVRETAGAGPALFWHPQGMRARKDAAPVRLEKTGRVVHLRLPAS